MIPTSLALVAHATSDNKVGIMMTLFPVSELWYLMYDCVWENIDIMTYKPFPHYWPFVRGILQSPVDSLHKKLVMWNLFPCHDICIWHTIDLVQDCSTSSVFPMEILQSCTMPSICSKSGHDIFIFKGIVVLYLEYNVHKDNFKNVCKLFIQFSVLSKMFHVLLLKWLGYCPEDWKSTRNVINNQVGIPILPRFFVWQIMMNCEWWSCASIY